MQIVGVIQEQHADRCRLFAQWHQFDWPILHDPLNRLGLRAVPIVVSLDANGVVQAINPSPKVVLDQLADDESDAAFDARVRVERPSRSSLHEEATTNDSPDAWIAYGDRCAGWAADLHLDDAVQAYSRAIELSPQRADAHFRRGVALRMRYDRSAAESLADFQAAAESWQTALQLDPNQYIYRRRIEQYGPRLNKPYPFYDWVTAAREAIAARGDTPVELRVEPSGAEIAHPAGELEVSDSDRTSPDPEGRIRRDTELLISLQPTVVPTTIRAGESARVHLVFQPTAGASWNNEAAPLVVWIEPQGGWTFSQHLLESDLPPTAESKERRSLELEVLNRADTPPSSSTLHGYALYYVCRDDQGECLYLRQDFEVPIAITGSTAAR